MRGIDMNKQSSIEAGTNVHRKLSIARQRFHSLELKKTGKNTFANYNYFELGDFLVPALKVFDEVGLGATVSFNADTATMTIVDLDNPTDQIVLTSPMGSAALKGCHEVQNIGAVETYQRRYLWVAALEIVEHDALDKTTGKAEPETRAALSDSDRDLIATLAEAAGKPLQTICQAYKVASLKELSAKQGAAVIAKLQTMKREAADA
jgi:hypothetical protein